MNIDQFDIWTSDISYPQGEGTGSLFLLILQNSVLNEFHPTIIVCPMTTNIVKGSDILRVRVPKESTRIGKEFDIVIDQIRVIEIDRLVRKEDKLPIDIAEKVKLNIKIVMDIEI